MTDYKIDLASQQDYRELSMLGRETFTQTFGHLYSRENIEMFLKKNHEPENYHALIAHKEYEVWVARNMAGEMIGYSVAGPCTLPVPDMLQKAGELLRLYVSADCQSKALGGRLMDKAMEWLKAHFDHLYISVYAENYGAQRFYQRYGFQNIHEYVYMVGHHGDREYIFARAPTLD